MVMFGDVLTFKCDPNIISNFVYVVRMRIRKAREENVEIGKTEGLDLRWLLSVSHNIPSTVCQKFLFGIG